jgi:hypothetical protein
MVVNDIMYLNSMNQYLPNMLKCYTKFSKFSKYNIKTGELQAYPNHMASST